MQESAIFVCEWYTILVHESGVFAFVNSQVIQKVLSQEQATTVLVFENLQMIQKDSSHERSASTCE